MPAQDLSTLNLLFFSSFFLSFCQHCFIILKRFQVLFQQFLSTHPGYGFRNMFLPQCFLLCQQRMFPGKQRYHLNVHSSLLNPGPGTDRMLLSSPEEHRLFSLYPNSVWHHHPLYQERHRQLQHLFPSSLHRVFPAPESHLHMENTR